MAAQTYNTHLTHAFASQYKPYLPQPSFPFSLPQKCKEQEVQVQQAKLWSCAVPSRVGCNPRAFAQEDVATSLQIVSLFRNGPGAMLASVITGG